MLIWSTSEKIVLKITCILLLIEAQSVCRKFSFVVTCWTLIKMDSLSVLASNNYFDVRPETGEVTLTVELNQTMVGNTYQLQVSRDSSRLPYSFSDLKRIISQFFMDVLNTGGTFHAMKWQVFIYSMSNFQLFNVHKFKLVLSFDFRRPNFLPMNS